jgi:TPR repeat protein
MDALTRQRLLDATEAFHEENDWPATEALWRPYVETGDLEAQFRLAYYYLFYSFDEEARTRAEMEDLLRTAANGSHPDAVYWLGHLYPDGAERDALLCKAGELGSLHAQRDLGALYATGNWTGPKDSVQAVQWYRRAAERGHADAQYNLGFMYLLGEGVQNDPEEGLRWLRLAAAQGDGSAMRLMADLYHNGFYGVPVDSLQAADWERQYRVYEESHVKRTGGTDASQ